MNGIGGKTEEALQARAADIPIYPICHPGGFELASGLAALTQTVFEKGLVDACRQSIFIQDTKPGDVVLMAVVVLHGKL